jgi:threonylcarbamoyladenosine tRNA methylthiotransferase MtaB
VIVGFPGETDKDFEESLEFVKQIGFARIHVFKYSKRPGTRAAEMASQVPEEVKRERGRLMAAEAEKAEKHFHKQNAGQTRRTLIFGPDKSGRFIRGLTDNGIDVLLPAKDNDFAANEFFSIKII